MFSFLYLQGENKLRQVSEERNSLTKLLYFSEFHQKGAWKKVSKKYNKYRHSCGPEWFSFVQGEP